MTGHHLMERLHAWSALLPLLLLLAGTYWLTQQVLPLPPAPDYKARHDPDTIVDDFSAMALGTQGKPRFLLAAQNMEHFPDDDTTHLKEPRLINLNADRPSIHISAGRGEVSHNGDEIYLHDAVRIVRDASATQDEMVITTSYLHVVPDQQQVDTDRPITMTEARGTTSAVGMQLDGKARQIRLLAQVRGDYEPAKR